MRFALLFLSVAWLSVYGASTPSDSLRVSRSQAIDEVNVTARKPSALSGLEYGRMHWRMEELERMPQLFGSADPMRYLQMLPGVSTNNDYNSGLHIQGCATAHNALELGGAPIFNASHLLGLFSVFTPSHFRSMTLVKNRHNARFPNRLGGSLSFTPTDSIAKRTHLTTDISFIKSEGTLTLPTGKRSTLYLTARSSYLNLFYNGLLSTDELDLNYGLRDFNLTQVFRPNEQNTVCINAYWGCDKLKFLEKNFEADSKLTWGNAAASVQWTHFTSQWKFLHTAYVSRYENDLALGVNALTLHAGAEILQAGYKEYTETSWGKVYAGLGWEYAYQNIHPLQARTAGSFINRQIQHPRNEVHEFALPAEVHIPLHKRIMLDAALRSTFFTHQDYQRVALSPRLTLHFVPHPRHKLFLHYGFYTQFLHQVELSNGGFPVNYWTTSTTDFPAEEAHSTVLGYHFSSPKGGYEVSIETYFKRLNHQREFYGSILDIATTSSTPEQMLLDGYGHNYGLDILVKRNQGPLTGWIAYTLSRSDRRFPALGRKWVPSAFDRRHDLTLVANYRLNRKWDFGVNFVYATGTPYTKAKNIYVINQNFVNEYGSHNGARLNDNHRLDISLTYHFAPRNRLKQSINVSVYNLYASENQLFRYMGYEDGLYYFQTVNSLYRLLPSVGYSLRF